MFPAPGCVAPLIGWALVVTVAPGPLDDAALLVTFDLVLVNPAPPDVALLVAFVCVPVPDDLIVGLAEAALPPVAPLPVPPAVVLVPVAPPTPLAPTTPWPLNWAA